MKTKLAMIAGIVGYLFGTAQSQSCKQWDNKPGLGGDVEGANRVCADVSGEIFVTEECVPDHFLCKVGISIEGENKCQEAVPFSWKSEMPPGDSCTDDRECFHSTGCDINGTDTCRGVAVGEACDNDKNCTVGNFCAQSNKTCTAVRGTGADCGADIRCGFGHLCASRKCVRYGSLNVGDLFYVEDEEIFPDLTVENPMAYQVCKTFAGNFTEMTAEGVGFRQYQCTNGWERNFTEDGRTDPADQCEFIMQNPNEGGENKNTTLPPVCGFNADTKYYCPARRGNSQFENENKNHATTWSRAPSSCHHRSTVQYCKAIEDNIGDSLLFRDYLRVQWLTTGDQNALVANNRREVGNAIEQTRDYWRLRDGAYGTVLTYVTLIAGIFAMTFVY